MYNSDRVNSNIFDLLRFFTVFPFHSNLTHFICQLYLTVFPVPRFHHLDNRKCLKLYCKKNENSMEIRYCANEKNLLICSMSFYSTISQAVMMMLMIWKSKNLMSLTLPFSSHSIATIVLVFSTMMKNLLCIKRELNENPHESSKQVVDISVWLRHNI